MIAVKNLARAIGQNIAEEMREQYHQKMRGRLDAMKSEIEDLKRRSTRAEANLELELATLVEELQIAVDSAERKLELLRQANDDQWHAFRDEFETVWNSARDMIRAVTAP